jgi:predicted flap endonuclease-1-like 5' DNA nuclease
MDLSRIKGVGEAVTKELSSLGIQTIAQLLDNYPRLFDGYIN